MRWRLPGTGAAIASGLSSSRPRMIRRGAPAVSSAGRCGCAVYRWLKDLIASGVRIVTLNGLVRHFMRRQDGEKRLTEEQTNLESLATSLPQ